MSVYIVSDRDVEDDMALLRMDLVFMHDDDVVAIVQPMVRLCMMNVRKRHTIYEHAPAS
jgi:hypothetical protein